MANSATANMGPPPTREPPRRSGRSVRTTGSNSQSPEGSEPSGSQRGSTNQRPALASTGSSSTRSKKLKVEDEDHTVGDAVDGQDGENGPNSVAAVTNGNGRSKRKPKDKDKENAVLNDITQDEKNGEGANDDETRCVCGDEEDNENSDFMVQCETCNVWQHGKCMGFADEDDLPESYWCELCRPDLHAPLVKKIAKRRQSSTSHPPPASIGRNSRSISPAPPKIPAPGKRRNTMNSRDAAFEASLMELIEATAIKPTVPSTKARSTSAATTSRGAAEDEEGNESQGKRKRTDDDTTSHKRTRSVSSASERDPNGVDEDEQPNGTKPTPGPRNTGGRKPRGGKRSAPPDSTNEVPPNHASTNNRKKGKNGRRAPVSHAAPTHPDNIPPPTNGRRPGAQSAASTREYRNSHAYAVSQQPLFTSWGLPDYLAHLEHLLPHQFPQPLEVRGANGEINQERGVKIRFPSKRTGVSDMNKRARGLAEWVGREQAAALERSRRRDALEQAYWEQNPPSEEAMAVDGLTSAQHMREENAKDRSSREDSMRQMEDLMQDLLSFQERFGPGAKRDRRVVSG